MQDRTAPHACEPDAQTKAIIDFVQFEDSTSIIWPWALSADEITQNEELLRKVKMAVSFDPQGDWDTDELYEALDRIVGVNPVLKDSQATNSGMTQPGM